jgi:NhaA family Na+:H+ antiporter
LSSVRSKTARRLLNPFEEFVKSESSGGVALIAAAVLAFAWANSPWAPGYFVLKETYVGIDLGDWGLEKPLLLWVNDGLMVLFFFLVGLEIKREVLIGELSSPRDALLAVAAALGGMLVPAALYAAVNWGGVGIDGWGVPVATDIAFALGILALLGDRVPLTLKVFLTALAIVDDLGAVLVIALFYTREIDLLSLGLSLGVLVLAFVYGRRGGRNLKVLAFLGLIVWFFMLQSGVHATAAGVLLALATPMKRSIPPEDLRDQLRAGLEQEKFEEVEIKVAHLERVLGKAQSPLHRLEHLLHPWVAFLVLPVFALFNAGVSLSGESSLSGSVPLGILLGLLLGKPLGVLGFSWLATKLGIASLPEGVGWRAMTGAALLAGIGFTMSLFVAGLAFEEGGLLDEAKLGILVASAVAALLGLALLLRRDTKGQQLESEG